MSETVKQESVSRPQSSGNPCEAPCYIISVSYGNDSIALIQLAHEQELGNVYVVYCDTGWAHPDWRKRVKRGETMAMEYGFKPMVAVGEFDFAGMVRMKRGFPGNLYQFCSGILKTAPFGEMAAKIDPLGEAVVIIGKRREESQSRADTPEIVRSSEYHEGRTVWHPLFKHTEEQRNDLIKRAGFEPLPHRSLECCPCVNANRQDLRETPEEQIEKVRELELEIGNTMFRPYRHGGAKGIDEVMEWAASGKGKFHKDQMRLWDYKGKLCGSGLCGI